MRALALAFVAVLAGGAAAAECRLKLSLALDVSSSVDEAEYRLQADGLADALEDPGVVAAFLRPSGVMLHIYEWSGTRQQEVVLDWAPIASAADLRAAAGMLRGRVRSFAQFPTAIGFALGFGARVLERGPDCLRATLDVSGDGQNNDGFSPELARREFPFEGVTINGLVIGQEREALRAYYERYVIHGPGAFVEVAADFDDFSRAMRRKLIREVGVPEVSRRVGSE